MLILGDDLIALYMDCYKRFAEFRSVNTAKHSVMIGFVCDKRLPARRDAFIRAASVVLLYNTQRQDEYNVLLYCTLALLQCNERALEMRDDDHDAVR